MTALRLQSIVLPGHRIEVSTPDLPEGSRVEIIVFPSGEQPPIISAIEIIRALKGHRLFQSPDHVRRHLQEERDAWDR